MSELNANHVDLIRSSFSVLEPQAEQLIENFYDNLFIKAPQVRSMFPDNMGEQRKHLLAAIGLVVKNADNIEKIQPALEEMGIRHAGYGAIAEHYGVVRDTLIETMADMAGDLWDSDLEEAWAAALNAISSIMINAGEQSMRQAA